jgi:hypothetical protein
MAASCVTRQVQRAERARAGDGLAEQHDALLEGDLFIPVRL